MKISLLTSLCAVALCLPAWSQIPPGPDATAPEAPSATPMVSLTPSSTASATPVPTISATPDSDDEDIDSKVEKKIRKHLNFTIDGDDHHTANDDVPWIAIPIVFIVFLAIFGTPVMIVAVILYFGFSKNRALHKTVRMMVEKGQPVPEALLRPTEPALRNPSDARRGIIWMMVGLGLMIFFGACNDWEGGAWSLGIIPFLVGFGYILVWKLDVRKKETSPRV